jgi:sortase A
MFSENRPANELSVSELEQALYRKKRVERRQRLQRLKGDGRVVEVAGKPPPRPTPPPLIRPSVSAAGALRRYDLDGLNGQGETAVADEFTAVRPRRRIPWRGMFNNLLLLVEVAAVIGLIYIGFSFWDTTQELNRELAQVQQAGVAEIALPTAAPTPVIGVAILPSGHKPPVAGRPPEPGEAGDIPAHLLPVINAYVPPPIPTPGPEQARRIQIPAISVDALIFQGDTWEQLKKGVGQHIPSGQPGQAGNMVLSAHNDIFGELFRHLDKLKPGDEFYVSTERQQYTYVVRELRVVEPTDVWVLEPTEHASATLISCYPYLVNNKRIIIFADLAATPGQIGGY